SLVVTDREKIIASVQTMADGVAARDVNGIFSHVSPRFSVAGRNKADFQQWAGDRISAGDVTSLRVWDFAKGQVDRDKGVATIEFLVKGNGAWVRGGEFFRCKARFFLDPDGEWRLAGFELFQPYQDPALAQPLDIPHLHR